MPRSGPSDWRQLQKQAFVLESYPQLISRFRNRAPFSDRLVASLDRPGGGEHPCVVWFPQPHRNRRNVSMRDLLRIRTSGSLETSRLPSHCRTSPCPPPPRQFRILRSTLASRVSRARMDLCRCSGLLVGMMEGLFSRVGDVPSRRPGIASGDQGL